MLNCNTYDVGLHAAMELGADKLLFMHSEDLGLPAWLPLSDAQDMLLNRLQVWQGGWAGGVQGGWAYTGWMDGQAGCRVHELGA